MANSPADIRKPALCTVLRKLLEVPGYSIPNEVFATYASLMAGLKSTDFVKEPHNGVDFGELEFTEIGSTLEVNEIIANKTQLKEK